MSHSPLTGAALRRGAIALAGIAAALALASPARAGDAPLTLGAAQSLAVARSQQVAAFGLAAKADRELAVAAGRLPDPMLKLAVENLPVDGPDRFSFGRYFMTMREVGVMQEWTRGEKRELPARQSELQADRSVAERELAVANVERDTALAWFERRYAEAMREVVEEQQAEARLQVQAADSAYRAGQGSQADALAARGALALLEDRMSDIDRRIRAAKLALARWVGEEAAGRPLSGEPPIGERPLGEHALRAHIERHPELLVKAKREEIAANEVKQAVAARKPDWNVELMYALRGPAFSNMVSLSVTVPLQWDRPHRQDREIAAKLAREAQAQAEREDALRMHLAEIGAKLEEWKAGRERIARYEKTIVPLAQERSQAVLAAYRGAKASLAEVLAARRDELDTRLSALQLQSENARTWAELAFLVPEANSMKDMK